MAWPFSGYTGTIGATHFEVNKRTYVFVTENYDKYLQPKADLQL